MRRFLSTYSDLALPEPNWRVELEECDPIESPEPSGLILRSVSPIYSLGESPFLPNPPDSYQVVFTVYDEPFVHIGKLSQEDRKFLWFSLGVASVISILPPADQEAKTESEEDQPLILCREVWEIEKGILHPGPLTIIPVNFFKEIAVQNHVQLPQNADLQRVIRELDLNFSSLTKRAYVLMPSAISSILRMRKSANALISDMAILETEILSTDHKLHPEGNNQIPLPSDDFLKYKRLSLNTDRLIQLNSASAYILSQSFYGGPPILRNTALVSEHSLLGVGTAIKALQLLTDFIIGGFSKCPISLVFRSKFSDITLDTYLQCDESKRKTRSLDEYLNEHKDAQQVPKMAYFSTRLGFAEQGH